MYNQRRPKRRFSGNNRFSKPHFAGRRNGPNAGSSGGSKRKRGENIDISRFIKKPAVAETVKAVEIKHAFADFRFCRELENNLVKRKYTVPTAIQDQSISHILQGRDLIGLADTGSGKTAAFLLPLIHKVFRNKSEKILIVTPTRELAMQIENELKQFSWGMGMFFATCVGGMPIQHQITSLKRRPNFIIGTPGRLKDLGQRGLIKFGSFSIVVLDEVDRMLDMGFIEEIKNFLSKMPLNRQSLFFSATLPPKIRVLTSSFLKNPVTVEVKTGETAVNIEQDIIRVPDKTFKFDQLQQLLSQPELRKVLIFIETKWEVKRLASRLVEKGFKAESIHGNKTQGQRYRALASFKSNAVKILVATDVAARGLDIKDITHVINYTVPQTYDNYIHRIGRTGRYNCKGKAITFVEVG